MRPGAIPGSSCSQCNFWWILLFVCLMIWAFVYQCDLWVVVVWVVEVSHAVTVSYVTDIQFSLWTLRPRWVLGHTCGHVLLHITAWRTWLHPERSSGSVLLLDPPYALFRLLAFVCSLPCNKPSVMTAAFLSSVSLSGSHWAWGGLGNACIGTYVTCLGHADHFGTSRMSQTLLTLNHMFSLCQLYVGKSTVPLFYVLSSVLQWAAFLQYIESRWEKDTLVLFFQQWQENAWASAHMKFWVTFKSLVLVVEMHKCIFLAFSYSDCNFLNFSKLITKLKSSGGFSMTFVPSTFPIV